MGRRALLAVGCLVAAAHAQTLSSPPVNVWLTSSWNTTNLLAEIIETVSLEKPDAFFDALNLLTDPTTFQPSLALSTSPEHIYVQSLQSLQTTSVLSEPGVLSSFERALALRAAVPRLKSFLSFYRQRYHDTEEQKEGCGSWVEWDGRRLCTPDEVLGAVGYGCGEWTNVRGIHRTCAEGALERKGAERHTDSSSSKDSSPNLTIDHIHPSTSTKPLKKAILYASLTSANFWSLHDTLRKLATADRPVIQYVFRHAPDAEPSQGVAYLSGWGVGLDLKKMDYLAVDDRKRSGGTAGQGGAQMVLSDSATDDMDELPDPILSLLQSSSPLDIGKPIPQEDLPALGFQATQLILSSPSPLNILKHLSQNFPLYANALSTGLNASDEVVLALGENMQKVQSGVNYFWLNGRGVDQGELNPYGLLRVMRKERKLFESLNKIGLTASQGIKVLTNKILSAPTENRQLDGLFDASDRPEGGGLIIWMNDLEEDERYMNWPEGLEALMQPAYGGQLPRVRMNVHNVIIALDLSRANSVTTLSLLTTIIQRGVPIRFGVVPIVETEEATELARVLHYLTENFEPLQAVGIFSQAASVRRPTIDLTALRQIYENLITTEKPSFGGEWKSFEEIVHPFTAEQGGVVGKLHEYAERLSLSNAESKTGHFLVNGKYFGMHDDWLRTMQQEIGQYYHYLLEKIFLGEIEANENLDISNYFYDLPTTAKRRNKYIYPSTTGPNSLRVHPLTDFEDMPQGFVYPAEPTTLVPLSMWIVADFDTDEGVRLVKQALSALPSTTTLRLSFIYSPGPDSSDSSTRTPRVSEALMTIANSEDTTPDNLIKLVEAMNPEASTAAEREGILKKLFGKGAELVLGGELKVEAAGRKIAKQIGFAPGDSGLIVNGRVIGPFGQDGFSAADFAALAAFELSKRVLPTHAALVDVLKTHEDDEPSIGDRMMAELSSIVAADQAPEPGLEMEAKPRKIAYNVLEDKHASFEFGNNQTAIFHFALVLNPLSVQAQRYTSLLEWVAEEDLVHGIVYLNPAHEVTELPLKRFYRYNLPRRLEFSEAHDIPKPEAEFLGLPPDPIYTLAMDVPQSWLVRPKESLHDLDNIQLNSLSEAERTTGVEAVFSLDYLVIEGHAQDLVTKQPPRGLQLQLSSHSVPIADTQVVANLGYFQLRAAPGVFQLEIRPGRGQEIYEMTSAGNQGWHSPSVEEAGTDITVASFEGITLFPTFRRREGQENADVLTAVAEDDSTGLFENIAHKVSSLFSPKPKSNTEVAKRQADINIFTVASGLLYERFASIMILSVLKNTDKTVKFWFIENFLSPSFLEFIPHFAAEYNFEYELVTYKWPSWLRMPTEKQRIIWGYKILFLDVLFPMDLKKVIFVDADQIVRADLHELVTLDLQGAPYGYTPMGEDSEDMDGFRFWKQGYWKQHLGRLPYHISALYVVDLVRFRQLAAGDRLRGQYQGLSADPNSLANLDQDLPNNMQREVPIFSLHEDWLWCETWCSKDRLHRAKTIDLCQNPKTKEPKLSRARQIPEWETYDAEIAKFARKLVASGIIHSSAAVEDVNALAGETTTKAPEEPAKGHDEL